MFKQGFANQAARDDLRSRKYGSVFDKKAQQWEAQPLQSIEGEESNNDYDILVKKKFDAVSDIKLDNMQLASGQHFVTVEARYGYVDSWIDDEEQLFEEILIKGTGPNNKSRKFDRPAPEIQQQAADRMRQRVDGWLQDLRQKGLVQ